MEFSCCVRFLLMVWFALSKFSWLWFFCCLILSNNDCTNLPVYSNWSFILHFDLVFCCCCCCCLNIHQIYRQAIGCLLFFFFQNSLKRCMCVECALNQRFFFVGFALAVRINRLVWGQRHNAANIDKHCH